MAAYRAASPDPQAGFSGLASIYRFICGRPPARTESEGREDRALLVLRIRDGLLLLAFLVGCCFNCTASSGFLAYKTDFRTVVTCRLDVEPFACPDSLLS